MSAKISLKILTEPKELEHIFSAVEDLAEKEGWPPDLVFRVNLTLEELGLNIMNHGHDEGTHEIEIELTSEDDALTIEIKDDGKPFDPLTDAPEPDLESSVGVRTPGGLGVHLVRTMMDELSYRREQGKNHVTLVSRRV